MPLSNAERQARWRLRQADKRDDAIAVEVTRRIHEVADEIARRIGAGRHSSAPCAACAEKDREIATLRAAKPRQPATPRAPASASEGEVKLRAQIKELRMRLRRLADKERGEVYLLKSDRRIILRALHPDLEPDPARQKLLDRALQIFNALPIREIDPD
jgi:hypothetical protein